MDELHDFHILHKLGLGRYENHIIARIQRLLERARTDVEGQLAERWPEGGDNTAPSPQALRLQAMLAQIDATLSEAHSTASRGFDLDFRDAAQAEAEFQGMVSAVMPTISTNLVTVSAEGLYAAAMARPLQGRFVRDFAAKLGADERTAVAQQIRLSFIEGESVRNAIRRVRNVAAITRRRAEALVRTSMTHLSASATREQGMANPDGLPQWQFIAVLDSRTSDICRSLAGKVYEQGKGPYPPRHPNCRSVVANLPAGLNQFADLSFPTWLERQPAGIQRDVLGPTRYTLYSDGGLTPDRMIRDGRRLTLAQLRERDERIFRQLGL